MTVDTGEDRLLAANRDDRSHGRRDVVLPVGLALCALIAAACWIVSFRQGAHLFHFDAKAHLVVARRTIDSLTPGWTQLGAVWLPLPHILNALPAQSDTLYTSGVFASALSFVCFVVGLAALGIAARDATGDSWAGLVALSVPALNPGWLYLQATPLIEALFLACVGLALAGLVRWRVARSARALAVVTLGSALSCWVRYEAWPLMALALGWAVLMSPPGTRRRVAFLGPGLGLAVPILAYGVHSWAATGIPFYAIGSENLTETRGQVWQAARLAWTGLVHAFGGPLLLLAAAALTLSAARARKHVLSALAVAACAPLAVTLTAYLAGHPQKARYPLLLAPAFGLALAAATSRRRALQGLALAAAAAQIGAVPWPLPVVRESLRDRAAVAERRPVLEQMRRAYTGGRVLASMGSLAPVLFELGQLGLPLKEVVHEGNGNFWSYAVVDPAREVSWIMIVPGDVLDDVRRVRRRFPEGFSPAFQFGRVVIYRRDTEVTASAPG